MAITPMSVTPFGLDNSPHAAFPSATKLPDGRVRVTWRESSGHVANDGRTLTTVGDPLTGIWAPPQQVVLDTDQPGRDMRPGYVSAVEGVVKLSYFWSENGVPQGAYVATSTDSGWTYGTSIRIDGGKPYAAVSGPVVRLSNKLMACAYYGRQAGEAVDSAWVALSGDLGWNWSSTRIANGVGSNWTFTEPFPVVRGNKLVVLYRDGGWNNLAMRSAITSGEYGLTWNNDHHVIATGATGNSASTWTSSGIIYTPYRDTATRALAFTASADDGATFWPQGRILKAPANPDPMSVGSTYAAPVDLGYGNVWCLFGMETSFTSSRLYQVWL